ncbi:MAG: type II secretion system GspH family protein [Rectinema sp.]|nr:type II secretion system GspH family protein [Rectinema sp.]
MLKCAKRSLLANRHATNAIALLRAGVVSKNMRGWQRRRRSRSRFGAMSASAQPHFLCDLLHPLALSALSPTHAGCIIHDRPQQNAEAGPCAARIDNPLQKGGEMITGRDSVVKPISALPSGERQRQAMTLVEILIAISVIAILMAMVIPAVGLLKEQSRRSQAEGTVANLFVAVTTYRDMDPRRRFPPMYGDAADKNTWQNLIEKELLWPPLRRGSPNQPLAYDVLAEAGLLHVAAARFGQEEEKKNCLLDPWGKPYFYYYYNRVDSQLKLHPVYGVLQNHQLITDPQAGRAWNWDVEKNQGQRASGYEAPPGSVKGWLQETITDSDDKYHPKPFPYIWSLGSKGEATDPQYWIIGGG